MPTGFKRLGPRCWTAETQLAWSEADFWALPWKGSFLRVGDHSDKASTNGPANQLFHASTSIQWRPACNHLVAEAAMNGQGTLRTWTNATRL